MITHILKKAINMGKKPKNKKSNGMEDLFVQDDFEKEVLSQINQLSDEALEYLAKGGGCLQQIKVQGESLYLMEASCFHKVIIDQKDKLLIKAHVVKSDKSNSTLFVLTWYDIRRLFLPYADEDGNLGASDQNGEKE